MKTPRLPEFKTEYERQLWRLRVKQQRQENKKGAVPVHVERSVRRIPASPNNTGV